jgi:hypothetical protein
MSCFRTLAPVALLLAVAGLVSAQDKKGADVVPALLTASGTVDKADKESLVVKPRGPDGKFQKALTLKVTGTSKVTVLTPQKRAGGVVLTQREIDAKDLVAGQVVAIVYAEVGKEGTVLLTAVAHPAPGK